MRKVLFTGINKVELADYKLGPLQAGYIRVRHLYSLISAGTERLMLSGAMGKPENMQPGYCAVGRIEQGGQTCGFKNGDIVFTHGSHADVIDVPVEDAGKTFIPINSRFAKQATFLQLGKVAMHGLHRVNIKIGDWTLVFGLGSVGNLAAQLIKLSSADRIIAAEPLENRRKIAGQMGIKSLDPLQKDFIKAVQDITSGGANIIIETSGTQAAFSQSFQVAAYGAQISLVAGHYDIRQLDMKTDFQNKELSIFGARRVDVLTQSTPNDRWTVVKCAQEFYKMIENGNILIDPLITQCVEPEKAPQMYDRLIKNDSSVLGIIFVWEKE